MRRLSVASLAVLALACGGSLELADGDGGTNSVRRGEPDSGAAAVPAFFDGGELVQWGSPQGWDPGAFEKFVPTSDRLANVNTSCIERCVPVDDLCEGVACDAGYTCVKGDCVQGCYFEPCQGVDCASGFYCASGRCLPVIPCSQQCEAGWACHLICPPADDACANVECGECSRCQEGACVDDPCSCTSCAPGEFCQLREGRAVCENSCECKEICAEDEVCELGQCVVPLENRPGCRPDCTNKACGSNDGCGGKCLTGGCDVGVCERGECVCAPDCSDKACGADDGCGNPCQSGSCEGGGQCVKGVCECAPSCDDKACGADDGCGNPCKTGSCENPSEFICRNAECICRATYVKDLCLEKNLRCGATEPSCGAKCLVGVCDAGQTCSKGECVCTAETVQAKCTAKGLACGDVEPECGMKCLSGDCDGLNEFCDKGTCKCDLAKACLGAACGDLADGCGGTIKCAGSCDAGYTCNSREECECTAETVQAKCTAKGLACGDIEPECGMKCLSGDCDGFNEFCDKGTCKCDFNDACGGKSCGDDAAGCPGERCTGCDTGYSCDTRSWECECTAATRIDNCEGKPCGASDGCGGTCSSGYCSGAQEVCRDDRCVCLPQCEACGASDGCGGTCLTGSCPGDEFCVSGACQLTCACGQKVEDHRCVELCSPTETLCGCGTCCPATKVCVDPTQGICASPGPE